MSEQQLGVEPQVVAGEGERKLIVFAVRVDPVLRQQIEGLRGITDQSVNEVGVEALTDWVTKALSDEAIREKAMADIEAQARRLEERKAAITGILGQSAAAGAAPSPDVRPGRPAARQRKSTEGTE